MRANKVHNEIKTGKITPRAREPCEMCRSEMRSSLGVVKLGILHLRLSRGLDARGCRHLRRRSVMPWWRRGSYATSGPISPPTLGGSRYFLLIIDDCSRLTWVAMLYCKSDVFEAFKRFKNLAETEKGVKIKTLRSDKGGEFTSEDFSKHCLEHGIKRQLTTPYSPHQNGVVERKNRTVISMVRAMLKAKDLPRELWGEAVSTAIYILNRYSTKALQGKSPHEKWTGRKPSVDHMRTFGSIVHVKNTKGHLNKLEDKSQPMVFIGYELGTKGYKCFDPVNFKVIISRDVIFEEGEKWTWSK